MRSLPIGTITITHSTHPRHTGYHVLEAGTKVENGITIGCWKKLASKTTHQEAVNWISENRPNTEIYCED